MKMSYFLTSNKRSKKVVLYGVFLALFLITLNTFFQERVSSFLHYIGSPLWTLDKNVDENKTIETLFSFKKNLIQKNKELKSELLEMKVEVLKKEILETENRKLKSICNRKIENREGILARVIKRPGLSANYDFFIIDIGEDKRLKKGDIAVVKENFVIGKVEKVFANTAEIKLFSSPENKMRAILKPADVEIEIKGMGGGNFNAKIPKGTEAKKGDIITIPSINPGVFAQIEEIEEETTNPFKTLYFKIPTDIFKTSWVKIIKRK